MRHRASEVFVTVWKSGAPRPVKQASLLMLAYSVVILVTTLGFALENEFTQTRELFRGLLRAAGMTGLAFWLLTLDKKAWWFSILTCGFFTVMGTLGLIALGVVGFAYDRAAWSFVLRIALPLYCLAHATVILAMRGTRQLFHTASAESRHR